MYRIFISALNASLPIKWLFYIFKHPQTLSEMKTEALTELFVLLRQFVLFCDGVFVNTLKTDKSFCMYPKELFAFTTDSRR